MFIEHSPDTQLDLEARNMVFFANLNCRLNPVISALVTVANSPDPIHHPLRQQIGIAIEGGGVGSGTSMSGAAGLEVIGNQVLGFPLRRCVKVVAGSSGGAPNALYFAGGRGVYGAHAYAAGYFTGENFIRSPIKSKPPYLNWRNIYGFLKGEIGVVNLKYLKELIINSGFQFNDQEPDATKLLIVATKVDPRLPATPETRRHVIKDFTDIKKATDAVEKSCHIPILAGRRALHDRQDHFLDGGISEHLPRKTVVDYLRESGVQKTYTLCFSSVPMNVSGARLSLIEQIAARIYPKFLGDPKLDTLWKTRYARAHDERDNLHRGKYSQGQDVAQIIGPPDDGIFIALIEGNSARIKLSQKEAMFQTFAAFGITDPRVQERLYANIPPTEFEIPL